MHANWRQAFLIQHEHVLYHFIHQVLAKSLIFSDVLMADHFLWDCHFMYRFILQDFARIGLFFILVRVFVSSRGLRRSIPEFRWACVNTYASPSPSSTATLLFIAKQSRNVTLPRRMRYNILSTTPWPTITNGSDVMVSWSFEIPIPIFIFFSFFFYFL